ncbi:MAG: hypothetical protein CFE21_13550 [Bacteroidetes bacterium B1(2017)]|nr:MAG: hypothetical protein CFE21_13550 [Bacteroidetes bacterium B1(2017)]
MNKAFFEQWDSFLYKYHLYYRNLSLKGKERFVKRVESIYLNVEIIGKEGQEINPEISILVVSNLVELTFGLKEFWLFGYEYIYLYPEAFEIKKTGQTVSGSTYQNKIIALSWQDFAKDHLKANDGRNISLAQYALALIRTVLNGKQYDIHFGSYMDTWFEIIKKECLLKSNRDTMQQLDENPEDLNHVFSKCVEMFFEKPELFRKELPTSYAHLCLLLNQDPLNSADDYTYDRQRLSKANVLQSLPKAIPINYKYKEWHWAYNFPFFGLTICPVVLYFLSETLLVQTDLILSFILVTGITLSILGIKFFKDLGLFKNTWLIFVNGVLGYSPVLVCTLLVVNHLHGWEFSAKTSKHEIASFYSKEGYSNNTQTRIITFNFSDDFLLDFPKARTFEKFEILPTNSLTFFNGVSYEIRHGLIGIPIVTKRELY